MRKLVNVSIRIGSMPGDPGKAAKFIKDRGFAAVGSTKADVAYLSGKAAPPADNRWFHLVEADGEVVGYSASARGVSERIPSCAILSAAVPTDVEPVVGEELLRLMFEWSADRFFAAVDGRGYTTIDIPKTARVVRDAAERAGFEGVHERGAGKGAVIRFVKYPSGPTQTD
jgi:hypothetical protein